MSVDKFGRHQLQLQLQQQQQQQTSTIFQGNYKWLKILPEIVLKYNSTKHTTIGMKPIDVTTKNEQPLLKTAFNHIKIYRGSKFKVGDKVRVSKYREAFNKGYTPNWSNEIFTVEKVNLTHPTTYILQDDHQDRIMGGFYEHELQLAKYPDIYLVEKVLKRKGNKAYVKWFGLPTNQNSWVNKNDLL
ncbi:uncharacterized protein LOC126264375 [Aethina tumida]|uniref:uncharacterized protein LOC126264375 n=1 Tax=Aethina tumida TaxID=116153 RepID=UPI00214944D0|nr:uncharacterized protein LOC126264375 [Aethina tumida]